MRFWKLLLPLLASTLSFAAQADRIAGPIDSSQRVTLPGQIHHKAKPQYDQGRIEPSFQLKEVTLLTLPTPSQQKALRLLVTQQQDPKSPNFHKWLTPEQYAERFGLSQNDIQKISTWARSQGLRVVSVARGRNWIVLSGTAAQIGNAFRTEIHRYNVDGETHFANAVAPSIPAALSGIAIGMRGLDDFHPKPTNVRKSTSQAPRSRPDYFDNNFQIPDFLAPGDIATIYDINALYTAGIDGTGQKLVIAGQTDVYLADLNAFRTGFGLPLISGCTTSASGVITACNTSNFVYVLGGTDPGVSLNDLTEADLDLEWSAATARGAQIIFVTSTDVFRSYYYAIDNNIAPVISLSYGAPCEFDDNVLPADEVELTKANALGITFLNSSGDSGAASCDPPTNSSTTAPNLAVGGLAVSYPASSPEVTGVGGTAIAYPNGFTSTYWGTGDGSATNGGTAQNPPLPEIAWNDDVELGIAFGAGTPLQVQESYAIVSSGGGASNCSVQNSNFTNCVSGFPQASWQTVTISGQNTRLVPDVSLLASPNFPAFIFCTPVEELSSTSPYNTETTSSCGSGSAADIATAVNGISSGNTQVVNPSLVGGTSASAPIFAGLVAMLNQYLGANGLGNINPTLYTLAKTPSNGAFHQVKSGNNFVYCVGGQPPAPWPVALQCPGPSGSVGSFGYDASNADATTGYNLVTGLGSVDSNALFTAWPASRAASSITITPSATNVSVGTSVSFAVTVTPAASVGTVSFSTLNNGITTVLGTATLNAPYPPSKSGTATFTTTFLPGGSNSVTATYEGDALDKTSTSASTAITVTGFDFTLGAGSVSPPSIPAGQAASVTLTITPVNASTQTVNFTNSVNSPNYNPGSCTAGLPAGALCSFNPGSVTLDGTHSANVTLTITTVANMPLGAQAITVTGTPSGAGGVPRSTTVNLTVTQTNQSYTLSSTNGITFSQPQGGTASIQVAVNNTGGSPIPFVANNTTALQLTYTCTGSSPTVSSLAAAEITCQLPNNGQPTNAAAVTVMLKTTPVTTQLRRPLDRGNRIVYALLLPGLFGVVFVGSRTRGLRMLSLIVVLGFATLWLGSCGGGGNGNNTQPNPGTPTGTYTVTIAATTGGAVPLTNTTNTPPPPPFTITLVVN